MAANFEVTIHGLLPHILNHRRLAQDLPRVVIDAHHQVDHLSILL
jgi:hypothetical protein